MRSFLLLSGLMLVLVGCGGGGGDGGGGSTPPPPTTGTISGYVTVPGTTASEPPSPAPAPVGATKARHPGDDNSVQQDAGMITKAGNWVATGGPTLPAADNEKNYEVLFRWADGVADVRKQIIINTELLKIGGAGFGTLQSFIIKSAEPIREIQKRLATYPDLLDVMVLEPPQLQFVPTDALYSYQWDMQQMGLERAWDITRGSATIRVAVIDSGIQINHAEFSGGRLVDGYDFVSDVINAGDGDGRETNPTDQTDTSLYGAHSHGTHVAGTIGANAGNVGVVGVDHVCKIMPIRTMGINGGGSISDIWEGMLYAADLQQGDLSGFAWFSVLYPTGLNPSRPRPTQAAHIINMSLGSTIDKATGVLPIQIYNDILSAIAAKNITVVVAAGNDGAPISTASYVKMPAGSPSVICVAATAPSQAAADYSNYGPEVTVCAPGGDTTPAAAVISGAPLSGGIFSADLNTASGGFAWLQGTSMAAPHVTGVCALLKAINSSLTPAQIKFILQNTAQDLGSVGFDTVYGAGFVLADRAVYAAAGLSPATQLIVYTSSLYVEPTVSSASFILGNNGGTYAALGTITYSIIYGSGASGWINNLTSQLIGTDVANIHVTIDRTSVPDGTYTATLTMISVNGGSLNIPVTMQVLSTPPFPPFPKVFVLLIDANTDAVVAQRNLVLPVRSFTFTNVAPGTYYVVAGTDLNEDSYIDDAGEYFGFYAVTPDTLGFPLAAGQNKTGVGFPLALVVTPSG